MSVEWPRAALLPDGKRLHLRHGPIDIVAEAFGMQDEVTAAYRAAAGRFEALLDELVAELPLLRQPLCEARPLLRGAVARRMGEAAWPHRDAFITPMAAVAGAVADEVLAALLAGVGGRLARAYVNNGGDIAFHLAAGESLAAGVVTVADTPAIDARVTLEAASPVRGLATSGWRGRSQSLGIADAVTVLARTAAAADAAATLIANAVDCDDPEIERAPATAVRGESDLGERLVTMAVPPLAPAAIADALERGAAVAEAMRARGLIEAAYLALQGEARSLGAHEPCVLGASE